jgi:hypothetical protein
LAVFFSLVLLAFFFFPLALKAQDVAPEPTQEYFLSLGCVTKWLPLEDDKDYRKGYAQGAVIKFKNDFKKASNQKKWTVHKDEDGCREGETKCDTCDEGQECSLFMPTNTGYFKIDTPAGGCN